MALLLRTHFSLAKASLRRNRTRSFLTCLGISIGVAAIILILSLMGSVKTLIQSQSTGLGSNLIVIRPTIKRDTVQTIMDELTASATFQKSNLTLDDIKIINALENIEATAPLAISINALEGDKSVPSATVVGTTPEFIKIQNFSLRSGSFLSENLTANSAVIGSDLASSLYGNAEPIGKTVSFLGSKFFIVGVLSETNDPINFNNLDLDNSLFVNAEKLKEVSGSIQIQQINIRTKTTNDIEKTANEIKDALVLQKSGDANFTVSYGDNITHPTGSLISIVSGILSIVAGISLAVGGIGIMNIMLVSVSERTHEIGVRKAVGASAGNIMLQFLFEALILSILGGIFGLILGYAGAFGICLITPFDPYISWEIIAVTFITALSVGLIFGLYPAIKAANKNPIYSLKFFR